MELCCINCFDDEYLKRHVKKTGSPGKCNFCRKSSRYCVAPEDLADLFMPVISLYSPVESFMPLELLKTWEGDFIWEKLDHEWGIFNDLDYKDQEHLLYSMFPESGSHDDDPRQFLQSWVEMENQFYGTDDEYSEEIKRMWNEFSEEIVHKNRFFPQKKIDTEILSELLEVLSDEVYRGNTFFRARINEKNIPFPASKMGKPPSEKSKDGRANPKGISYLYLASDPKTAISEVRPTVADTVTVGKFKTKDKMRVANLMSIKISAFKYGEKLGFYLQHLAFLKILGDELSKAVVPHKEELKYIPLQYLCELIKIKKFDGIIYKSSLSDGFNFAIFEDKKVKCLSTALYKIEKVEIIPRKIEKQ